MPSRVKGRIYSARDLPVMDLKSNLTDAYVEIKYADLFSEKTEIVYKTLNPVWNKDFRIEIPDDAFLKKYPLEFKVYDYDRVSSNDIIGIILIDLSNLLNNDTQYEVSGWFPIYDTIRGVRGELNLSIKLEYFGNNNPADLQSHVEFFSSRTLFANMRLKDIHGFVEELIVDDDPEYHWKDNFRTSRSSNEARQYLLYKLSGKLRLKIGNKVAEMGGNAVLGYQTFFDFEDNGNIVARAIGTACTLKRVDRIKSKPLGPGSEDEPRKRRFAALALPADVQCLTLHYAPPPIEIRVGGLVSARSVKVVRASANRNQKMEQQHWDRWWSEIRHEIRNHARSLNCQFVIGYSETVTLNEDMAILTASGTAVNLTVKSKRDVRPADANNNNTNTEEKEGTDASIRESTRDLTESSATLPNPSQATTEKKKQKPCSFCHVPYKPTSSPFPMQLVPCRMCQVKFVPEIMIATIDPPPGIAIVGRGQLIEARVCRTKKKTSGESGAEQVSELIPFLLYDLHRQLFLKMRLLAHNACFGFTSQIKVAENFIVAVAQATSVRLAALPEPMPLQISNNLRPTQLPNQYEFNDELADSSSRDDSSFSEGSSGEDKSGAGVSSGINTPAIVGSLKTSSVIPAGLAEQSENAIENLLVKMSIQNAKDMENEPIIEAPGIHSQSTAVKDPVHESEEIETNLPPVGFKAEVHDEDVNEDQTSVKPKEDELILNSKSVVVEMDDNIDEEMIAVLLEPNYVENFALCNTELLPGVSVEAISNVQYVTMIRQFDWSYARNSPNGPSASSGGLNLAFSSLFRTMYNNVVYKLQGLQSCSLNNLKIDLKTVNDDEIQILLTAMVVIESKKISKQQQDKLKLKDPVPSTLPDDVTTTPVKKEEKSKEKSRKDKKEKEKEKDKDKDKEKDKDKDKDKRRKDKEKDLVENKDKKKSSRDNIGQSSTYIERDIFDDDIVTPEPKPEPSPQKKKSDESPRNKQKRTKSNSTLGSTVNSEVSDLSVSRKQSQPIKIPPLPPRDEWSSTSSSTVSSTSSSPNNTPRNNMLQQAMLSGNLSPSRASPFNTSMSQLISRDKQQRPSTDWAHIHVTPMSFVPGTQVIKYLGRVELHFIKESFIIREQGGMSSFTHRFLLEVCQIAKSHVHSLGGNCLLSYRIMNVIISEKESKNQGYCLVEVSGDVVFVAPVPTSHKQVLKGFKKLAELSKSTK